MAPKIKPSLWWVATAPVVFVLGIGSGLALLLHTMFHLPQNSIRFVVPGSVTVQVDTPGTYVLWHDAKAVHEGRTFDQPRELPQGLTVSVVESATGERLPARRVFGAGERSGGLVRHAVAKYRIETAGDYDIRVFGDPEQRLFSFSPSYTGSLALAALGCGILNLIGWAGAPAIIILIMSRRTKMKRLLPGEGEEDS